MRIAIPLFTLLFAFCSSRDLAGDQIRIEFNTDTTDEVPVPAAAALTVNNARILSPCDSMLLMGDSLYGIFGLDYKKFQSEYADSLSSPYFEFVLANCDARLRMANPYPYYETDTIFLRMIAYARLSAIFLKQRRVDKAIAMLDGIVKDYQDIPAYLADYANGPIHGVVRMKKAEILTQQMSKAVEAIRLYQANIAAYTRSEEMWGFEWNVPIALHSVNSIAETCRKFRLGNEFMIAQMNIARKSSAMGLVKLAAAIHMADALFDARRVDEAVALITSAVRENPRAYFNVYKYSIDYPAYAVATLFRKLFALDPDSRRLRKVLTELMVEHSESAPDLAGFASHMLHQLDDLEPMAVSSTIASYEKLLTRLPPEFEVMILGSYEGCHLGYFARACIDERLSALRSFKPYSAATQKPTDVYFHADSLSRVVFTMPAEKEFVVENSHVTKRDWLKIRFEQNHFGWIHQAAVLNVQEQMLQAAACYLFENNGADASLSNNHGKIFGRVAFITDQHGIESSAVNFHSGEAYNGLYNKNFITVAPFWKRTTRPREVSYAVWLKAYFDSDQAIISHGDHGAFNMEIKGGDFYASVKLSDGKTYSASSYEWKNPAPWQHFAAVWRRGIDICLYVDGTLKKRTPVPDLDLYYGEDTTSPAIGADLRKNIFLSGEMDDLMVFTRALNADEIAELVRLKKER
ncbi:MAG TPA: LamG domain-containing protein [Chryseosolibacter sp.]|nr:LamG domain-containing protein [Chryseosolibacter sp.]